MIQVLNYGGGVQSCAIAVLILQGRIPKPDFAVIADTGREKGSTWEYLHGVVEPAFRSIGIPIHRPHKDQYAYRHDDLWSRETTLIPVFTTENGKVSKMPGYCSNWWKKEVVQNYLKRKNGAKVSEMCNWIGFLTDEHRRAARMMASKDYLSGRIWLPLIEGVRLSRAECIQTVQKFGWPTPPRSSCWMCPNAGDDDWREIKANRPDEFKTACEIDDEIRLRDPHMWLHKSAKPLREVDFSESNQQEFCHDGLCFL